MRCFILSLALVATAAFNVPVSRVAPRRAAAPTMGLRAEVQKVAPAATAAMVLLHAEAAHAKGVIGVNGGLDFGPLAGTPRVMLTAALLARNVDLPTKLAPSTVGPRNLTSPPHAILQATSRVVRALARYLVSTTRRSSASSSPSP